jgi:hypothetical protein
LYYGPSERTKLSIIGLLLLLILGVLIFTAVNTAQAVHNFQKQYSAVKVGDVGTIRPWMTLHVISHVYHVPEDYLGRSLVISDTTMLRKATLYEIASRKKQPVEQVVHTVQRSILMYRKDPTGFTVSSPHPLPAFNGQYQQYQPPPEPGRAND